MSSTQLLELLHEPQWQSQLVYLKSEASLHSTERPPRFLSLDVFSGQKTKEVIHSFKALKCTTSFIPSGTTGFVQVYDTVVNRPLKAWIKELAHQHIDEQERDWVEGKYSIN